MTVHRSSRGLFEFDIFVVGPKKSKKLTGLFDTGSNVCACTYPVITTLQIRPVSFEKLAAPNGKPKQVLVYSTELSFDVLPTQKISIFRVSELPEGIQLIVGMSFISNFQWHMKEGILEISA